MTCVVLIRSLGTMRRLRTLTSAYLSLLLAYGLSVAVADWWLEQAVKRDWSSKRIPSLMYPSVSAAWAGILLAATLIWLVVRRHLRQEDNLNAYERIDESDAQARRQRSDSSRSEASARWTASARETPPARAGPWARQDASSVVSASREVTGRANGEAHNSFRPIGFGSTERRRSRTDRAVGYTTALVLKTSWATGPMPLHRQR